MSDAKLVKNTYFIIFKELIIIPYEHNYQLFDNNNK